MHTTYEAFTEGLFSGTGALYPPVVKRPAPPALRALTPYQRELLANIEASNEPSYFSLQLPIPRNTSASIDLVQHAWRAVASHNAALRARFVRWQGKDMLRIPRDIANIEFGMPKEAGTDHEQPATLVVNLSSRGITAWIRIHRALIDNHSLPLICRDFSSFFSGIALERRSSFEDFVEKTLIRNLGASKLYWRTQAMDAALAPIRSISIEPSPLTDSIDGELSEEETASIIKYAESCNQSLQCVLYAAWAITLASHTESGSSSVTFAVTGRDPSNDHDFVGLGDQVYPLIVRIDGGQSIKDMIKSVASSNAAAARHAFIGYQSILEQFVEPEGPTFLAIRVNEDDDPLEHVHHYFDRFSLAIEVDISHKLSVRMHHGAVVGSKTAQVILNHFFAATRSIIEEDTKRVSDLSLISEEESSFLLELGEPVTAPAEGLVHKLFEAQVEKTPNSPAVQFENNAPLTYDQLNKLANGVARQLPIRRGMYVPVCLQRSSNLIVALCAILKSGAAYVTTDPDVPVQRNNFIYQDTSAEFAIVDRYSKGTFPNEVVIEDLVDQAEKQDTRNLNVTTKPEDVVYVIYTSGSTGNPKGVLLEHRSAYSGLNAFPYIEDLRQLLFHNPVFSAAQRSVWSTLKQGGCLCLASKENLTVHIGKTINEMRINTIDVTPSTAAFITPGSVPCLKRMTVAGELINPALVPQWLDRLELLNAYGLSENTQFNWRHIIERGQNPQNIGRPVDTTTAYVLKPGTTELSPLLVPGELCLGGHQLARSYLNRPKKTQEVFIPNPFGPGRLYRTGDLVMTHADGSIEMIGRIDFSVKINDQRVDPGESNSIIQMHSGVRDSCVVAAWIGNRMSLVAAVVYSDEADKQQTLNEIRVQLEKQLPRYMIPSYWISSVDLPLNINGKVDIPAMRKICEEYDRAGKLRPSAISQEDETPTETASEQQTTIRNLFAEALAISADEVPLDSGFLSIGGSSLEAIKVASAASNQGIELAVSQVMMNESITSLAASLGDSKSKGVQDTGAFALAPKTFKIDRAHMEDVLPATPLQQGILTESMMGVSNYMLFRFYKLRDTTVEQALEALQKVVDSRPLLRTTIAMHERSFIQVIWKQLKVPLRSFEGGPKDYTRDWVKGGTDTQLEEPLIRFVSLKDNVVAIETHHVLVDTWSYHFIEDDVRQALRNEPLISRPSFSGYVKYLDAKPNEPAYNFWKDYLRAARPTHLKTGGEQSFSTEAKLDHVLLEKKRDQLASALYAAWGVVLMNMVGSDDVTFLVNVSGREAPVAGIMEIQGPTLSTVPMRVRASDETTVEELLQTVTNEFWKLAEHAHLGLANILKATSDDGSLTNSGANFLVSLQQPHNDSTLESLDFEYPNVRDLVTIEMDSKDPSRARLYSSRELLDVEEMLSALKLAIKTIVQEPSINVGTLRSRMNDKTPSTKSSPISDPIFDKHDTPTWNLEDHSTESISSADNDTPAGCFDDWKAYIEDCVPTVLEPTPARNTTAKISIPLVKANAAARKAQVPCESLIAACVGIVVGRHCEIDPLFASAVHSNESMLLKEARATRFVPQKMKLVGSTLGEAIKKMIEEQEIAREIAPLRIEDMRAFAEHFSTSFDVLFVCRSGDMEPEDYSTNQETAFLKVFEATILKNQLVLRLSGQMNEDRCRFLLDQVSRAIQTIISSPSTPVQSLQLLGDGELSKIYDLAQCNPAHSALVHVAFEEWAAKTPKAQALQLEDGKMTYEELNTQANQLARHLASLGVEHKSMVPLYLDKTKDMIIAILAVLKAGATYVPLSPDNPAKRNNFVMDEINAKVLVTHSQYESFEGEHSRVPVYMDRLSNMSRYSSENTGIGDPDTVAYCLFTSGSTGTPKGVAVSHRAIATGVRGHLNCERTTTATRHLIFANYTFDVSVHDIFSILGSGATLCVATTSRLMSDLVGVMNEMRVTQTFLTPTVARLFTPAEVPTMETLLCGGEALTTDIIDTWAEECTLINMYGPTELAVDVTYNWVDPETKSTALGYPIDTCSIMIVDRDSRQLSPLGGIGELCVAGGHLADGYLNRQDLTDKAFVPCPIPGFDRMYRTGDLGRWRPDNTLEYLGRIDNQIKLNGHRIELGEIEQSVIQSGLSPTCVAMVMDKLTRPQLAVFCVFEPSEEAKIQEPASSDLLTRLRDELSGLAHYMVPHLVFPVGNIPRMTASNKSDRKALRAMAEQLSQDQLPLYSIAAAAAKESVGAELSSAEEEVLATIWADMFTRPKSTMHASTSFSALGGDSIAAINLVSACRKSGFTVSVNDILKEKTLGRIANCMKRPNKDRAVNVQKYEPPSAIYDLLEQRGIAEDDVEYMYPCAPGQAEFLSQGQSKKQHWTVTAVRALPHDANEYLVLLQKLTAENDILRTTFTRIDGHGWVGVVFRDPVVDFRTVACDPSEKDRLVERLKKRSFAFGEPFVRYLLLKYPDGSQDLAMRMDHGLWDGTSLRIFDDQVLALQRDGAFPPTTPFKDFVFEHWHSDKSESLSFWKDIVQSGPGSELHASKPQTDSAYTLVMDENINVNKVAQGCGVTPATLFQGIFQLWLAEYSKRQDASYDYLLTGRNVDLPNPQSINGVCANFLPFRLPVQPDQELSRFMADTQDFFWEATKHGNVNLDDIYGAAGLDRQSAANRVLFLYQPFEPSDTKKKEMRWVVLAMSKSWMTQPYALMEEVHKTDKSYKIVIKYDSKIYSVDDIKRFAQRQSDLIKNCLEQGGGPSLLLKSVTNLPQ